MDRVLLVRQGSRYGPEYITALTRQIEEHNPDTEVVTLTDRHDTPGRTRPLRHDLEGWWSKLELFAPEQADLRPFLYLDLDSFVFESVAPLMGGDEFRMIRDFNGYTTANSSVLWVPKVTAPIWERFSAEPVRHMNEAGRRGDQYYLGPFAEALWEPVESGITSFKRHGREGPVGNVMTFHGKPKMPDIANGWVAKRWKHYAEA